MKLTRKIATSIAACALAFGMLGAVGCSSEEKTAETTNITTSEISAQDIEVTNVGFSVVGDQTVNYAFTVNNPNTGYIADGVTFTIEGYSADGVMLVGGGETIQNLYPGVQTAAAGTAFLSDPEQKIESFEVRPLMEHVIWTKTSTTPEEVADMFQVSNVAINNVEGSEQVTGTLTCDLGEPASSSDGAVSMVNLRQTARVVVLLKNQEGAIIGGGSNPSIMLDASMISIGGTPTPSGEGEEGGEGSSDAEQTEQAAPQGNIATTSFLITIPGDIKYASYEVIVTPGI